MAEGAIDLAVGDVFSGMDEGIDQFSALPGGKEPVGGKADDQKAAPDPFEGFFQTSECLTQVVIIHGFGKIQIGIGVESVHETGSLIIEIGFDAEFVVEIVLIVVGELESPAKFLMHGFFGEIGDVADHSGHRQADGRILGMIIVPLLKILIAEDGVSADGVKRDALRAESRGGGDGDRRFDPVGIANGPFQDLHASHAASDDGQEFLNAQVVQQVALQIDHIADGNHGKGEGIGFSGFRIDAAGPCGSHATAEAVGANDKIFVRVYGLARPDHDIPPSELGVFGMVPACDMGITGKGVANQNRVIPLFIEFAVGLVRDVNRPEGLAAFEGHSLPLPE